MPINLETIQFHPVVHDFPPLTKDQMMDLEESIRKKFTGAIVFWGKLCIDGFHRVQVCKKLGVVPNKVQFEGTEEEAVKHAWTLNYGRRHSSKGERQLAAGKLAERMKQLRLNANNLPEKSQEVPNGTSKDDDSSKKATAEASKQSGVPERTVARAQKVVSQGSTVLQKAVADGTVSVNDAAKVASQPKAVQNEAVQKVAAGEAQKLTEAVEQIEAAAGKRELPPKARRKSGRPANKNKDILMFLGRLVRAIDNRKRACGEGEKVGKIELILKPDSLHGRCIRLMELLEGALRQWNAMGR